MNLLLYTDADRLDSRRIRVTDRRLEHLRKVLKSAPGDSIRVGELHGKLGKGEVLEINDEQAILSVELNQTPPARMPLYLVLALPRPKMLRRILRTVAELGVDQLHLINSYRVEKSYWQTPVLQPAAINEYLIQGLEQAQDTVPPKVHCHQRFKPFVEDTLPALIAERDALLAEPGDYPPCPRNMQNKTLIAIGPEGGFIPYEVERLIAAGCRAVSLGSRILRVETAVTALLSRVT
ncbi:MAG: 16S rRNA (uracil(1498)-N(3))-methyltransferase [Pseudomonadota bacterium]